MNVTGIILSARPWEMEDERTKEKISGISIQYVFANDLEPVKNEDGTKGHFVGKSSISVKEFSSLKHVPGVYDMNFDMTIKAGKPALKLVTAVSMGKVGEKF